jgi:hypothetical protein
MEFDGPTQSFGEYNASPSGGSITIDGVVESDAGQWTVYVYNHNHLFVCSGTFEALWLIEDTGSRH